MTGPSSWRALWRLARRDLGRRPAQSWLVFALIALPVAAMVAGLVLLETRRGTVEDQATATMGRADAIVQDVADEPRTRGQLRSLLPDGTTVTSMVSRPNAVATSGGARLGVAVVATDADGMLAGMYTMVRGRHASAADEVALSSPVLDKLSADLGDTVAVDVLGSVTVVGEVLDTDERSTMVAVAAEGALPDGATWAVDLPADADDEAVRAADVAELSLFTRREAVVESTTEASLVLVLGGFGLVEAGMVVAAAFAVSIRRRQRELGLLAASGGAPRHLRATVRLSGVALGLAGAVGGAALGLVGSWLALPFVGVWADRVVEGLVVSPTRVVVAVVLGLVTAVVAAAVPARGAVRLPITTSLAGRRPPTRPGRRWAVRGLVLVAAGLALVVAAMMLASSGAGLSDLLGPNGTAGMVLLGSVLGVLGFGAASPWLLEHLGRIAPRLPLGLRLAVRDTGRFRSRNGPVITAVIAGLSASIALGTALGSFAARDRARYVPSLANDQLAVFGPRAGSVADEVAAELDAVASTALQVPRVEGDGGAGGFGWFLDLPAGQPGADSDPVGATTLDAVVGGPETVRALGGDEQAVAALERGEAVLWWSDQGVEHLRVQSGGEHHTSLGEVATHVVARTGPRPIHLPDAVIAPASIRRLGLADEVVDVQVAVVRLDGPVSGSELATARAIAARTNDTSVEAEEGFSSQTAGLRTAAQVVAGLTGLVVVAIALALAAAEARDDQRTLVAVGASPRVRRELAAGRAAVLALLGGLLAVPAGLLPAWGVLAIIPNVELVVAWREALIAALGLPLVAVAGAWLLTRPTTPWGARRRVT